MILALDIESEDSLLQAEGHLRALAADYSHFLFCAKLHIFVTERLANSQHFSALTGNKAVTFAPTHLSGASYDSTQNEGIFVAENSNQKATATHGAPLVFTPVDMSRAPYDSTHKESNINAENSNKKATATHSAPLVFTPVDMSRAPYEDTPLFIKSPSGKPHVKENALGINRLFASISHSGGLFALAVAENSIGMDLQLHNKQNYGAIKRLLSGASENSDMSEEAFYKNWCSLEALAKAVDMPVYSLIKQQKTSYPYRVNANNYCYPALDFLKETYTVAIYCEGEKTN